MTEMLDPITPEEMRQGFTLDAEERWYTGSMVTLNQAQAGLEFPEEIIFNEDTLREGRETPGVNASEDDRLRIAERLIEAGFREMTVGYPGANAEDARFTRLIKSRLPEARYTGHVKAQERDWKAECDRAIDSNFDIAFVEMMVGIERVRSPWFRREEIPERSYEVVRYLKEQNPNLIVSFAVTHPGRSDLHLVYESYRAAAAAKPDRLYAADGPGCLTPEAMRYFVRWLRDLAGPEVTIAVHNHDDFGLALANSLAGLGAGAKVVDTVMNGLGDRAGNCPTEEMVAALEVLYGVRTGIKMEMLAGISDMVEELYRIPKAPNKAIVGANPYRHSTDGHVATLLEGDNWYSYECIKAEALGVERTLEFGPMSIHAGEIGALAVKMRKMGIPDPSEKIDEVVSRAEEAMQGRDYLSEEKIEAIIREVALTEA